jgi:hypothetical protein
VSSLQPDSKNPKERRLKTHTFICGCGHSGTTLLANIFANHSDVFIPLRETNCFLKSDRTQERWALWQGRAKESGRSHFMEKTPRHLLRIDVIRKLVPGARFMLLVRDGRDVAASYIKRFGEAKSGSKRWIRNNQIVRSEQASPDVLVARYDELVTDLEATLRTMCNFAGLPYEEALLRYHEAPRNWFGEPEMRQGSGKQDQEHKALRNWQVNQPIYDDRGKWRKVLSEADLEPFREGEGAELLAHFGYGWDIEGKGAAEVSLS